MVSFRFEINCIGWLDCFVNDGYSNFKILHDCERLGDGFQNLLNAFYDYKYFYENNDGIEFDPIVVSWGSDTSKVDWCFKCVENKNIFQLSEINELGENKCLISSEFSIDDFETQFYLNLKNLLKGYGLIGYKRTLGRCNFPIAEFLELSGARVTEYLESGSSKSNIKDEFEILINIKF